MTELDLRYEITVEFRDDSVNQHSQSALSEIILDADVGYVLVDQRVDTDSEHLRIVLGFENKSEIANVRGDPHHRGLLDVIEENVDRIETSVWEPAAIEVGGDGISLGTGNDCDCAEW